MDHQPTAAFELSRETLLIDPIFHPVAPPVTVASLWRFPVKSMGGEPLDDALLNGGGMAGDRKYAFESSGAPPGMLRVTGSERRELLRYRAITKDGGVFVTTPSGETLPIESATLLSLLPAQNVLTLTRSATPQTDCRPLALISYQTIQQLSREVGRPLDPRRFRANLYLNMAEPFAEDLFVGKILRIGAQTVLRITERDPRCRFITLDPDSTEPLPGIMKILDRHHQGRAGIYAEVLREGMVRQGDLCTVDGQP